MVKNGTNPRANSKVNSVRISLEREPRKSKINNISVASCILDKLKKSSIYSPNIFKNQRFHKSVISCIGLKKTKTVNHKIKPEIITQFENNIKRKIVKIKNEEDQFNNEKIDYVKNVVKPLIRESSTPINAIKYFFTHKLKRAFINSKRPATAANSIHFDNYFITENRRLMYHHHLNLVHLNKKFQSLGCARLKTTY